MINSFTDFLMLGDDLHPMIEDAYVFADTVAKLRLASTFIRLCEFRGLVPSLFSLRKFVGSMDPLSAFSRTEADIASTVLLIRLWQKENPRLCGMDKSWKIWL